MMGMGFGAIPNTSTNDALSRLVHLKDGLRIFSIKPQLGSLSVFSGFLVSF
jgi:hypothetical protein